MYADVPLNASIVGIISTITTDKQNNEMKNVNVNQVQ